MSNRIFDGKTSKLLLQLISSLDPLTTIHPVSVEELTELRTEYNVIKRKLLNNDIRLESLPRNYIYYEMIKKRIKNFSWDICYEESSNKTFVKFVAPRFNGKELSLFSLLMNTIQYDNVNSNLQIVSEQLPKFLCNDFIRLLNEMAVITPNKRNMNAIIDWIKEGLSGKHLIIFSLTCPDYSVEITNNPLFVYKYTFRDLGRKLGVIGKRIIDVSQGLKDFFKKYNIKYTRIIAMADYEALSASTRKSVDLNYEEFMNRLNASLELMNDNIDENTACMMFTELCGGQEKWKKLVANHELEVAQNYFKPESIFYNHVLKITYTRKKLYDRWLGEKEFPEEHLSSLLKQAAEYSAVGEVLSKKFENCLIIGADHPALSIFYSTQRFIPTLYLKRNYI